MGNGRGRDKITVPYEPNARQSLFHACGADEVVYGGAKGGGKAESLDTLIPTPAGWTTMGNIKPGDIVFGENGQPEVVLAMSDVMHGRPCYRLTFDDGTEVIADEEHLWKTYTASDLVALYKRTDEYRAKRRATRKKRGKGKRPDLAKRNTENRTPTKKSPCGGIRTTKEIFDTLTVRKDGLKNHAVMNAGALRLPEKHLPVDPYVFGVWLGDGCHISGEITTADIEILSHIEAAGYKWVKHKNKYAYGIYSLITDIRKAGAYANKHIPMSYLRASKSQRLALLQGLMDTDGHARKHGGVEFMSNNYRLADGVRELAVSLGWKAAIREGKASLNGRVIGKKYRVVFTPDTHVFRLKRKRDSQRLAQNPVTKRRFIVSVEPTESVPVKCIKVSGNGMFLCSKAMIPTHNSCGLVMEALAYGLEYQEAIIYLFRETYDDLEANIIREWKEKVPKELYNYHETKHIATLINGTIIYFRYIRNFSDAASYQGRSMDFIGVDELTNHEEESIQVLLSCLRSPKGYPPRFRGTCNPGGIGHFWVKKRYIDPTDYGEKQIVDTETGNIIAFIPAKVYDNYVIMQNDPAYVRRLENLPPALRKAYKDGDWDAYEGQAFAEFNREIHVCEPFVIPDHWPRWRSVDNGYADPFSWYWFAVSEDGIVYIYREYTRDPKDPKVGYSEQAKKVVELSTYTKLDEYGNEIEVEEPYSFVAAGLDAWATHVRDVQGKTLINYYEDGGLSGFVKPITDRKLRKATWHEYLKPFDHPDQKRFPGKKIARVQIFSTCKKLIETLPVLIEDEKNTEAVAECNLDHWYDGAGYGLIVWHSKQSKAAKEAEKPFPLAYKDRLAKQQQLKKKRGRLM